MQNLTTCRATLFRCKFSLQIFLLRDKLITQGEKHETRTQNLQWNNVAREAERLCISYLSTLTLPPLLTEQEWNLFTNVDRF